MTDSRESPDPGAVDDHTAEVAGKVTEALEAMNPQFPDVTFDPKTIVVE